MFIQADGVVRVEVYDGVLQPALRLEQAQDFGDAAVYLVDALPAEAMQTRDGTDRIVASEVDVGGAADPVLQLRRSTQRLDLVCVRASLARIVREDCAREDTLVVVAARAFKVHHGYADLLWVDIAECTLVRVLTAQEVDHEKALRVCVRLVGEVPLHTLDHVPVVRKAQLARVGGVLRVTLVDAVHAERSAELVRIHVHVRMGVEPRIQSECTEQSRVEFVVLEDVKQCARRLSRMRPGMPDAVRHAPQRCIHDRIVQRRASTCVSRVNSIICPATLGESGKSIQLRNRSVNHRGRKAPVYVD